MLKVFLFLLSSKKATFLDATSVSASHKTQWTITYTNRNGLFVVEIQTAD